MFDPCESPFMITNKLMKGVYTHTGLNKTRELIGLRGKDAKPFAVRIKVDICVLFWL